MYQFSTMAFEKNICANPLLKFPPTYYYYYFKDGIHKEQRIHTHAAYSIKQIQVHAQVIAFLMNDLPA